MFIADWIDRQNPFQWCEEGSEAWVACETLLQQFSELGTDLAKASWKRWDTTSPSDEEHRASYTEEERSLEGVWKEWILARRSRAEIEEAAKSRCFRGAIELNHIRFTGHLPRMVMVPNQILEWQKHLFP
jgi:hypothetical protein